MTEDQFCAAVRVIQQFLACRGYDERRARAGIADGHWLLQVVNEQMDTAQHINRAEVLATMIATLESGSYLDGTPLLDTQSNHWNEACSAYVRNCAGLA